MSTIVRILVFLDVIERSPPSSHEDKEKKLDKGKKFLGKKKKKWKFRLDSKFPSFIKYLKYFQAAQKNVNYHSTSSRPLFFHVPRHILEGSHENRPVTSLPFPSPPLLNPPPFVDINARSSSRHETHRLSHEHTRDFREAVDSLS